MMNKTIPVPNSTVARLLVDQLSSGRPAQVTLTDEAWARVVDAIGDDLGLSAHGVRRQVFSRKVSARLVYSGPAWFLPHLAKRLVG